MRVEQAGRFVRQRTVYTERFTIRSTHHHQFGTQTVSCIDDFILIGHRYVEDDLENYTNRITPRHQCSSYFYYS